MTAKRLREEIGEIRSNKKSGPVKGIAELRDLVVKEKRPLTEDENSRFDALSAEVEAFDTRIAELESQLKVLERAEILEGAPGEEVRRKPLEPGRDNPPAGHENDPAKASEAFHRTQARALQAWVRCSSGRELDDQDIAACRAMKVNLNDRNFNLRLSTTSEFSALHRRYAGGYGQRALSTKIGETGAFTIAPTMAAQIEVNMLAYGGVLAAVDQFRTDRGGQITYPTFDDTSNVGTLIGENTEITSVQPTFGAVTFGDHKISAGMIQVPTELLEDSSFDVPSLLSRALGERIARGINLHATTGSGAAGKPRGITVAATTGKTTASSTSIGWNEPLDLINSVDPAYRTAPRSGFIISEGAYQHLQTLMDGIGRPLWAPGPNEGPPATLRGYPYFVSQEMGSSLTSGAVSAVFGNLERFKVRLVNEIKLVRLLERFAEYDQQAFLAVVRFDSGLVSAGTAPIKKMVQV